MYERTCSILGVNAMYMGIHMRCATCVSMHVSCIIILYDEVCTDLDLSYCMMVCVVSLFIPVSCTPGCMNMCVPTSNSNYELWVLRHGTAACGFQSYW